MEPQKISAKYDELVNALQEYNETAQKRVSVKKVISTLAISLIDTTPVVCKTEEVTTKVKEYVKPNASKLAKVDNIKADTNKQKMTQGVVLEMVENGTLIAAFILDNPVSKEFANSIKLTIMHKKRTKGVKIAVTKKTEELTEV